jgi:site-specific recombinase XerC
VKQALAAVRMLFDWMVARQVLPMNPASSVRGPTHVVKRGKTPVLTADQARQLLDAIDTADIIGLRDRALIGLMVYSFARVSAAVGMKVDDYFPSGKRRWFRLHENGGKRTRSRRTTTRRPTSTRASRRLGSKATGRDPYSGLWGGIVG